MDSVAKRDMLNSPSVQLRQAIIELKLCGQLPKGLSTAGMSSCRFLSEVLKLKNNAVLHKSIIIIFKNCNFSIIFIRFADWTPAKQI